MKYQNCRNCKYWLECQIEIEHHSATTAPIHYDSLHCRNWTPSDSIAYKLGYNTAQEPKSSINYQEVMTVPINSFSRPSIQAPQYIQGWKDGKNAQL